MNCCNPMTGQCDQGPGCAAYMNAAKGANELPVVIFDSPEQPMPSANLAARANEHIRRPERLEAGRAHLLAVSDAGPGRFVRVLDWVGNQWDKLNALSQVCAVVAGVALCFAVAVAAVG